MDASEMIICLKILQRVSKVNLTDQMLKIMQHLLCSFYLLVATIKGVLDL